MQPARTELFWPPQLVRKWLQFKPTGDDFNADNVEHDSIMADEEEEERETGGAELPTSLSGLNIIEPQPLSKPPRPLIRGQSETLRKQYVDTKEYRIAAGTWNVAGKPPPEDLDLDEWIESCQEADIYVLGFQEIVPLNAGNVLCVEDDAPAAQWERLIRNCLNNRYPSYRQKSQSAPQSPWRDTNVAVNSELYIDDIIEGVANEDALCSLLESGSTATPAPAAGLPSFQEEKEEVPKRPPHWKKRYRLAARERFASGRRFSADGFDAIFKPDERRLLDSSHSRDKGVPSSGGIRSRSYEPSLTGRRLSLDGSSRDWSLEGYLPGPGEGYHSFLDQDEILETPLFPPGSGGHRFSHQSGDSRSHYSRVASKQMVGIFISVWVRTELRRYVHNVKVSCVGCGLMRYLGNKGSVSVSMSLHQTSFCFICSHLTSGHKEGDELRRNQDVSEILRRTVFPRSSKILQLPENIMSHDCIIWLGDLNYRIAMPDHEARKLIAREDWESLLEKDQLKLEQNGGRVFDGWQEGPIYFPPTYKYEFNSDQYSGENSKPGEKRRTPAWCDRILYLGKALRELSYVRTESRLSDHRPVSAVFLAEVERLSRHKLKRAVTFAQPVNNIHPEDISPHLSSLRGLHKVPNPEIDVPSLADVGNPHPIAKLTVSQSFKHKLRRERSLPPTGCMKVGDDMEISSHGFAHPKMANTLPVF
ncbi:hypothetical protein R1sor_018011 [Riccia sorocarpa]|uniref:Inositol polyphosphate-related phosphatase domain-containing protein n=1 Tax=Riccia sorocarpa TaxID=122646 RepID=A0ABD3IBS3_9MARC